MKPLISGLILLGVLASTNTGSANDSAKIPLNVLYLSRINDVGRTKSFADFLSQRFELCLVENRADFKSALPGDVDVVILDWPQSERRSNDGQSPVGPLKTWETPTVLLGSAGLLMAEAWNVIGDAG